MTGWIALHKRMLEWEWYSDTPVFRLFMHCLLAANHEEKKWKEMVIKRGQLVVGRDKLAALLDLTPSQLRTAEGKLQRSCSLDVKTTNKFTTYTVVKYEDYQSAHKQTAIKSQTNRKPIATPKQDNKITSKQLEEYMCEAEEFWETYPFKRGSKKDALQLLVAILNKGVDYGQVISGVRAYRAKCEAEGTEPRYVPHATKWLREERWTWSFEVEPHRTRGSHQPKGKGQLADEYIKAGLAEYLAGSPF